MTKGSFLRTAARRAAVEQEIVDAAWSQMAHEGVAALSVREVARSVGMRQQSLTYYFPTRQELFDALFVDGFTTLRKTLEALPAGRGTIDDVVSVAATVVNFCVSQPARYHLMFQRTAPGFTPSDDSHDIALGCLNVLVERLAAAGVTDPADVALVRGLISGLAAEQIANDPNGRHYIDQLGRGVHALFTAVAAERAARA